MMLRHTCWDCRRYGGRREALLSTLTEPGTLVSGTFRIRRLGAYEKSVREDLDDKLAMVE